MVECIIYRSTTHTDVFSNRINCIFEAFAEILRMQLLNSYGKMELATVNLMVGRQHKIYLLWRTRGAFSRNWVVNCTNKVFDFILRKSNVQNESNYCVCSFDSFIKLLVKVDWWQFSFALRLRRSTFTADCEYFMNCGEWILYFLMHIPCIFSMSGENP